MPELTSGPLALIVTAVLGYLLGSVPFGLVVTRAMGLGDPRGIGSGNIGATNVLRTGRKGLALATLLADAGKGILAVVIGRLIAPEAGLIAGLFAFLGHVFPVWLGFKGGKGIAVFLGIVGAISWPVGIMACAIWLGVALITRYSSLSALTMTAAVPFLVGIFDRPATGYAIAGLTLVAFYAHRANIERLLKGLEPRIGGAAMTTQIEDRSSPEG